MTGWKDLPFEVKSIILKQCIDEGLKDCAYRRFLRLACWKTVFAVRIAIPEMRTELNKLLSKRLSDQEASIKVATENMIDYDHLVKLRKQLKDLEHLDLWLKFGLDSDMDSWDCIWEDEEGIKDEVKDVLEIFDMYRAVGCKW